MKNIQLYDASKYAGKDYTKVSKGIFRKDNAFYMSFSFEQEPELEEGEDSADISQYPLEDLLDKFNVHVSDFFKDINSKAKKQCVIEVSSPHQELLESMKSILGKHVFNRNCVQNGEEVVDLVIE